MRNDTSKLCVALCGPLPGVAEKLDSRTGLIWSCDLNFSLQAFHHQADYFFFLNEASREELGTGLTRWQYRVEQHKDRGNEQ